MMLNPDNPISMTILDWLSLQYPKAYAVTFAMEDRAKIPMILIASAQKHYHGCVISLRLNQAKAYKEQIAIQDKLRQQGYFVKITQGFAETVRVVEGYLQE
jgi:exonuclease III